MKFVNRPDPFRTFVTVDRRRAELGLSMERLCAEAGVTLRSYQFFKSRHHPPKNSTIRKLQRALRRLQNEELDP